MNMQHSSDNYQYFSSTHRHQRRRYHYPRNQKRKHTHTTRWSRYKQRRLEGICVSEVYTHQHLSILSLFQNIRQHNGKRTIRHYSRKQRWRGNCGCYLCIRSHLSTPCRCHYTQSCRNRQRNRHCLCKWPCCGKGIDQKSTR